MNHIGSFLKKHLVNLAVLSPVQLAATSILKSHTPIFMLHRAQSKERGVYGDELKLLEEALVYLRKNQFEILSIEELISKSLAGERLPKKTVSFTVDDGFWDQADLMAPLFAKYDCPATFFLVTEFVTNKMWLWDSKIHYILEASNSKLHSNVSLLIPHVDTQTSITNLFNIIIDYVKTLPEKEINEFLIRLSGLLEVDLPMTPPDKYKPMGVLDIERMVKLGMKVAPHTVTHPILSNESDEYSRYQIVESWRQLKGITSETSPVFCYPVGRAKDFLPRDMDIVKETGMIGAVSSMPGYFDQSSLIDPMSIPRFSFPDSMSDFKQYSSWIEKAKGVVRGYP